MNFKTKIVTWIQVVSICVITAICDQDIFISFFIPVIFFCLASFYFWKFIQLIKLGQKQLTRRKHFFLDFYIMSALIILAVFITIVVRNEDIDVRGWWPFIILVVSCKGMLFSLVFAFFGLLLNIHKRYTILMTSLFYVYFQTLFISPSFLIRGWTLYFIPTMISLVVCLCIKCVNFIVSKKRKY